MYTTQGGNPVEPSAQERGLIRIETNWYDQLTTLPVHQAMLDTIEKHSLSEQVFNAIRSRILNRELGTGSVLPSERELSESLGVNRGAIREAIKRLQQARLVRVRHGGATVVESFENAGGLELLPSLIVNAQGQLNTEIARGVVLLRKTLAPLVAGQAAQHGGASLANSLDELVSKMKSNNDTPTLQKLAFDYWALIVAASGNVVFKLAFNSMNETYLAVWNTLTVVMEAEFRDIQTLEQMAQAIRAGEVRRCEVLARQHVELGTRALQSLLDQR